MARKQVLFRSAAREKILRGTTQLADSVRLTLGPRSKSVLIEKKWGAPIVCNDGVTIAKEFDLKDPEENLGAPCSARRRRRPFDFCVDGLDLEALGLPGKPDPALYLEAARRLGVQPSRAMLFDDALVGVEAGERGGFGCVVGIDHGQQRQHGADVVIKNLLEVHIEQN